MTHEVTLSVHSGGWIRASCSCGRFNGEAREVTLDRLNGAVHEHIEIEEAAVINRDAVNDRRLGRDVGTCPATQPPSDLVPWPTTLTCDLPSDHIDNPMGTIGLTPGTRAHRDPSGVLWVNVGGEGYGTESAITSEDQMIDIETGRLPDQTPEDIGYPW